MNRIGCKTNHARSSKRLLSFESLDSRILLHGGSGFPDEPAGVPPLAASEAQYSIHHPPRLQLGNAPVTGTPDFDGTDQVDLVWQTKTIGESPPDEFTVEYRLVGVEPWMQAQLNSPVSTGVETRTMFSATLSGLQWSSDYEYRLTHRRDSQQMQTYQATFRTRHEPGDNRPFSFAAYGDSATNGRIEPFRSLQSQINAQALEFSVLLGDNIYPSGSHSDADARFDPEINPEGVEWNRSHIDHFAVGNNDVRTDGGRPSRELFSVPNPTTGFNAHAQPPAVEQVGFNYSYDYGNVHFVTVDTNSVDQFFEPGRQQRVSDLIDYIAADLAASTAQWKIVHVHHPFIGTEKNQSPDDVYFRELISKLNAVDADLFLSGHSHTFSWTYPLQGFSDDNGNAVVEVEEVDFDADTDGTFAKGSGLVQVVSGVGGGSLRSASYDEPYFAAAYSKSPATGPLEHGFARIDVTERELRVSYISGNTGQIIGDADQDGIADADEPFFAQFRIVDSTRSDPDVNRDGILDSNDIDVIHAGVRENVQDPNLDLNQDGNLSTSDAAHLLKYHLGTWYGDSNLDGVFDMQDLQSVFEAGQFEDDSSRNSGWAEGDWDGDGEFTTSDLVFAFQMGGYRA